MLPKVWQNIQFIQRIEIPHVGPHWTIYFLVRVVSKRDEQEGSVQQAHGETFEPVKPWMKEKNCSTSFGPYDLVYSRDRCHGWGGE